MDVFGWAKRVFSGGTNQRPQSDAINRESRVSPKSSEEAVSEKEQIEVATALSLSEHDHARQQEQRKEEERKRRVKSQIEEDENLAKSLHAELNTEKLEKASDEREKLVESKMIDDEMFAKSLQDNLNMEDSLAEEKGKAEEEEPPARGKPTETRQHENSPRCFGCEGKLEHEELLTVGDNHWHACCFRCHACYKRITKDEHPTPSRGSLYHESCYAMLKASRRDDPRKKCSVCKTRFITGAQVKYHPFWRQFYCPWHENKNRTASCSSCERLEPGENFSLNLEDGRKLCLECLDSSLMDTYECQALYFEIREYFEGMQMKLEQEFPLLLVEKSALNAAMKEEQNGHREVTETRGICLSEEQTICSVSKKPMRREGNMLVGMETETQELCRTCDVTAILIMFGLPRLLTGSIIAHELMHAWFRLRCKRKLDRKVEEGMCQVISHMWLESQKYPAVSTDEGPSSSSTPKKGKEPEFEKKLFEFFKYQIESDPSEMGEGFRKGFIAVENNGLRRTLDHICQTGEF